MYSSFFTTVVLLTAISGWSANQVRAESHTIRFVNNCGHGTPTLVRGGKVVATGDFTSNGMFQSGIAFLQTGPCTIDGVNCQTVEMNMANPQSFADLSLIPDHQLNVETSFSFYGGDGSCDGLGASCADKGCDTAYHKSNDDQVTRSCRQDNINLLITFCGGQGTKFTNAVPHSLSNLPPANPGNQQPSNSTSTQPPANNNPPNNGNNNSHTTPPPTSQSVPSQPADHTSPPSSDPSGTPNNSQSPQCIPRRSKRSLRARAVEEASQLKRAHVHMHKRASDLRGRRVLF